MLFDEFVGEKVFSDGIFLDQGSNSSLLQWQVDSLLLSHQRSPSPLFSWEWKMHCHKDIRLNLFFKFCYFSGPSWGRTGTRECHRGRQDEDLERWGGDGEKTERSRRKLGPVDIYPRDSPNRVLFFSAAVFASFGLKLKHPVLALIMPFIFIFIRLKLHNLSRTKLWS